MRILSKVVEGLPVSGLQGFSAAAAGLLATSVLLAGCGGTTGVAGVVPVSGTVDYQGQAVAGATVVFHPDGEGRAASGITDAQGRFALTTLTAGDGALPGAYQVTVTKTEVIGGGTGDEEPGSSALGQAAGPTVNSLLPEKYSRLETSGLTAEVAAGGENQVVLRLDQ